MLELEAQTEMFSPNTTKNCVHESERLPIVVVDLTADSPEEDDHEVSLVSKRISHSSRKEERSAAGRKIPGGLDNLARLFDRTLLAEPITEDRCLDCLRLVIGRNVKHNFKLMGPYTNPLWHQLSVVNDCILVNDRLAAPCQRRSAVLKRIHRGHPGQEAMLNVKRQCRRM